MKRLSLKHTEEWALLDLLARVDLGPERPVLCKLSKRIRGRAAVKRRLYGLQPVTLAQQESETSQ